MLTCPAAIREADLVRALRNRSHWHCLIPPPVSVTENGFAVKDETSKPIEEALSDHDRVHYFQGTTSSLLAAVTEDGVDIRSYFAWSVLHLSHESTWLSTNTGYRSNGQLRMVIEYETIYRPQLIPLLLQGRWLHDPFRRNVCGLRYPETLSEGLCALHLPGWFPGVYMIRC